MTIYEPITPTYLYIKQHSITGLKYFGKTTQADPYKYLGSGTYWTNHYKKHGKEHIKTLWVSDLYYDTSIVEIALHFSYENNIVESKEWANLKLENGLDGGFLYTTHNKTVVKDIFGNISQIDISDPRFISKELVGIMKDKVNVIDKYGNSFQTHKNDPNWLNGSYISHNKNKVVVKDLIGKYLRVDISDSRYLSGEFCGTTKGLIIAKDIYGNSYQVQNNDPRWVSGELVGIAKGSVTLIDKSGVKIRVPTGDPRFLNGELVSLNKGKKRSLEDVVRMKNTAKKEYIITDPNGNIFNVKGLTEFCIANNLPIKCFCAVNTGKLDNYKGWLCKPS